MLSPAQKLLPRSGVLAWRQLAGEKLRLTAAVAGIAFAVIMMMMQIGFYDALYNSTVLLHCGLKGELVVVGRQYESVIATKSFTQRRLYQALSLPEVRSVSPVYLGTANWKNPDNLSERAIFVVGINPVRETLQLPSIQHNLPGLKIDDAVLFDAASRKEYGPIAREMERGRPLSTELNGHKISVAGIFQLGTSFAADGNVVTSDSTFLHLFPERASGMIDLGMIQLNTGADAVHIRDRLKALLPEDVRVVTREEFQQMEHDYWADRTPIGFVIGAGLIVGFIVGGVIVYQILYTDVLDHLKEYATLKAIGYPDKFLFNVVLQEAVILSTLGFIPGCAAAGAIFYFTRQVTLLPAGLTFGRSLLVFTLALAMCMIAGSFAMRKLRAADPADIF